MNKSIILVIAGGVITAIGAVINNQYLWSGISNMAIPWLCTALGISFVMCSVHASIGEMKSSRQHWALYSVIVLLAAICVFTDSIAYSQGLGGDPSLLYNELEVVGFAIVYGVVLYFIK